MDKEKILVIGFSILLALFIVSATIFLIFFSFMEPGNGHQTGYITAVEKNGVIWKTGRVYVKTDVQSSQEDSYCVIDESVYEQLAKLSSDKKIVTLNYSAPLIVANWNCGGESSIIRAIQ